MGALPFAVVKATGELVDVHDVLRGKACACVCPGCLAPVVAKHGEVNIWHFAHEADAHTPDVSACRHAFYRSIRRLLIERASYFETLVVPALRTGPSFDQVRPPKPVEVHLRDREGELHGVKFDLIFDLVVDGAISPDGPALAITLNHPGRLGPPPSVHADSEFAKARCGLVSISLETLWVSAIKARRSYRTQLMTAIEESDVAKEWLFHPLMFVPPTPKPVPWTLEGAAKNPAEEARWFGCAACARRFTLPRPAAGQQQCCPFCRRESLTDLGSAPMLTLQIEPWHR